MISGQEGCEDSTMTPCGSSVPRSITSLHSEADARRRLNRIQKDHCMPGRVSHIDSVLNLGDGDIISASRCIACEMCSISAICLALSAVALRSRHASVAAHRTNISAGTPANVPVVCRTCGSPGKTNNHLCQNTELCQPSQSFLLYL